MAVSTVNPPRTLTTLPEAIVIAAVLITIATIGVLQWRSTFVVVEGGFWFDDVTFELPRSETARLGGPITEHEKTTIASIAEFELRTAYADLRIACSANHHAFYRVLVAQDFNESQTVMMLPGAAGQSRALRPLGGSGSVSFVTLAVLAIHYAPPRADRAAIIDGMGRGIGRSAAHEFAHQLLPDVNIHASRDDHSYEFASSDRAAQYYEPMHWDIARPALLKNFGR